MKHCICFKFLNPAFISGVGFFALFFGQKLSLKVLAIAAQIIILIYLFQNIPVLLSCSLDLKRNHPEIDNKGNIIF
jgi:hypothetical protein